MCTVANVRPYEVTQSLAVGTKGSASLSFYKKTRFEYLCFRVWVWPCWDVVIRKEKTVSPLGSDTAMHNSHVTCDNLLVSLLLPGDRNNFGYRIFRKELLIG